MSSGVEEGEVDNLAGNFLIKVRIFFSQFSNKLLKPEVSKQKISWIFPLDSSNEFLKKCLKIFARSPIFFVSKPKNDKNVYFVRKISAERVSRDR